MTETRLKLEPGRNELPQLYNASCWVGGDPPVRIVATTTPELGTAPGERRDPRATTVALGMDWPNAIRLGVEVLRMAKATRQELPEGVAVPDQGLIGIDLDQSPMGAVTASDPPPAMAARTISATIYKPNGMVGFSMTNGLGEATEFFLLPEHIGEFCAEMEKQGRAAIAARDAGFPE